MASQDDFGYKRPKPKPAGKPEPRSAAAPKPAPGPAPKPIAPNDPRAVLVGYAPPAAPAGYESLDELLQSFMLAGFGANWKYTLPAPMRFELRNAFYGGFACRLFAMLEGLGDSMVKEIVPLDLQLTYINWQWELDVWRASLVAEHDRAYTRKRR